MTRDGKDRQHAAADASRFKRTSQGRDGWVAANAAAAVVVAAPAVGRERLERCGDPQHCHGFKRRGLHNSARATAPHTWHLPRLRCTNTSVCLDGTAALPWLWRRCCGLGQEKMCVKRRACRWRSESGLCARECISTHSAA